MRFWILVTFLCGTVPAVEAQSNVFFEHVTAYVNKPLPPGLTLLANPLDTTNNTIAGLFRGTQGALPEGTRIYLWSGVGFAIGTRDDSQDSGWSPPGFENLDLSPGKGAFIENPGPAPVMLTFVGEVLQGSLTNHVAAGYQLVGSIVPQAGRIDTVLGFPVADGDQVYQWTGSNYMIFTADSLNDPPPWGKNAPVINVAESFFSRKSTPVDWIRYFQIQ